MKLNIGLLFLMLFCNVQAKGLENYLKKPVGKSNTHSMKNIDFIYMINLDQRPEKFASCIAQLQPYGINPFRFSAVNGWELSLETINELGVKYIPSMGTGLWGTSYLLDGGGLPHHEVMQVKGRNYFCHCMAHGTIGIVLSHLSVLKDAYDSGYQTIWIMEDDVHVVRDPHLLSTYITKLDQLVGKNGWDILFTDKDTKDKQGNYVPCLSYAKRPNFSPSNPGRFAQRKQVNADFMKIGARYGAYSMIIRKSGMKKILDFIMSYKIFLPYDMDFYLPNNMRIYTLMDDVISTQPQALSDNGAPGYQSKGQAPLTRFVKLLDHNELIRSLIL